MAERFDELVKLVQEGRRLKDEDRAVPADSGFDLWLHNVTEYLLKSFSPKQALEWQALPDSPLIYGGRYYENQATWVRFHSIIRERIEWLGKLQLLPPEPDALELSSLAGLSHLDSDLRDRCLPLVKTNPADPKVWDSAVRTAGVVLEERLRRAGNIKDNSVGRDLVNRVFGKAGTLAKHFDGESERDGYRDLFAGIVGAFRNPSAHRLIDPNPEEGWAYIVFVNLLLKHLAALTESGSTTRATREGFLAACDGGAAPFFAELLDEASKRQLKISFGGKGFSVRVPGRVPFFYCYPPGANGRTTSDIELFLEPVRDRTLHEQMRSSFLEVEGTKASGDYTIRLPVSSATIPQAKELFQKVLKFMDSQRLSEA